MKARIITIISVFVLTVVFAATAGIAESPFVVNMTQAETETETVLTIKTDEPIYTVDFTLNYDVAVLTVTSVELMNAPSTWTASYNETNAGQVIVFVSDEGESITAEICEIAVSFDVKPGVRMGTETEVSVIDINGTAADYSYIVGTNAELYISPRTMYPYDANADFEIDILDCITFQLSENPDTDINDDEITDNTDLMLLAKYILRN